MRASFLTLESTTFAGRLDPRVKLGLCVAGSLVTLLLHSTSALLLLLACTTGLALTAESRWSLYGYAWPRRS